MSSRPCLAQADIARQLADHTLFAGLSAAETRNLLESADAQEFSDGAVIVREHDAGDTIHFIVQGHARVRKHTGNQAREQVIGDLSTGDAFGELAFLDGSPRSSSVVAAGHTVTLALSRQRIATRLEDGERLLAVVEGNIARLASRRLKTASDRYAQSLEREVEYLRERREFGHFFVATVVVVMFATLTTQAVTTWFAGIDRHSDALNWLLLALLLLPMAVMARLSGRSASDFGLTLAGWRPAAWEGLGIGVVGTVVMLVAMTLLRGQLPSLSWHAGLALYPVHAFLQEFVSRGVIQGCTQRFLDDRRGARSVCIAALLFGLAHVHYGLAAVAITFASGLLFGALYLRHRNLVGVTAAHGCIGLAAFTLGVV